MKFEVCISELEALKPVLIQIENEVVQGRKIVLLTGDLGAGKTTLVKHFVEHIGGKADQVDSPTFSIVNSYEIGKQAIHHFDLYRLISNDEIEDIGFMEYIDSGAVCFVEWPEKVADFLPSDSILNVKIAVSSNQCREYYFSSH